MTTTTLLCLNVILALILLAGLCLQVLHLARRAPGVPVRSEQPAEPSPAPAARKLPRQKPGLHRASERDVTDAALAHAEAARELAVSDIRRPPSHGPD